MDRSQNMVVNIAFYENVFFILSLFRTREFTPASCKSYLAPRNQRPTLRILEMRKTQFANVSRPWCFLGLFYNEIFLNFHWRAWTKSLLPWNGCRIYSVWNSPQQRAKAFIMMLSAFLKEQLLFNLFPNKIYKQSNSILMLKWASKVLHRGRLRPTKMSKSSASTQNTVYLMIKLEIEKWYCVALHCIALHCESKSHQSAPQN